MPKKPKKPESRRSKIKHASLEPRYNSRIRQEYIDIDYVDELDDTKRNVKLPNGEMVTEREYMSRFMDEWNNAGVGPQHDPKRNGLHRTVEEIKDCTDRNNKRNNDLQGQMKAQGKMLNHDYYSITNLLEDQDRTNLNEHEDTLIEILDRSYELDDSGNDDE